MAQQVFETVAREGFRQAVRDKGAKVRKWLFSRLPDIKTVRDIRGVGLMWGVQVWGADLAELVSAEMARCGVRMEPEGSTLMFMPPLTLPDREIEYGIHVLEQALRRQERVASG
jgi:4-aminobutyrate aminotransferase-like enzyme